MLNKLKKIIEPKFILYGILFFSVFSGFFIDGLHFPNYINYINDFLVCILFLWLIKDGVFNKYIKKIPKNISVCLCAFTIITIIGCILNFQNIFLIIFGVRTIFRFFLFFAGCFFYLDTRDIKKIFALLFYCQLINASVALYQYFILDLKQDNCGGIFGHGNGAVLNTFQILIYTYFLVMFLKKKEDLIKLLLVIITSLTIAALAEEKIFFVYFIMSLLCAVFLDGVNVKKVLIMVSSLGFVFLSLIALAKINGSWNIEVLFNFKEMIEYADNAYGISRLNPYSYINKEIFQKDVLKYLFGHGIGNCNSSTIDFFSSEFYVAYKHTNYNFFTHAFILIETGYLGLISFFLFFIVNIYNAIKKMKNNFTEYCNISVIMGVILIVSMMVGPSLMVNGGYIGYIGIALYGVKECKVEEKFAND